MPDSPNPEALPTFISDPKALLELVDGLRLSGIKSFRHPSGLELVFEGKTPNRVPSQISEGW